jgi:murein DD-endopeptidase MepM/ murein hydrolase activator NlpD
MQTPLDTMRIRRQVPNNTFGMVRNQGTQAHQGWDLSASVGTPIYAVARGRIREIRDQGAYGLQISLEFQNGGQTLYAFYAHLSSVACAEGQTVLEGDLLGYTGKTGNASNLPAADDHLHFEIRTILHPGLGLGGRVDPGTILGYQYYSSGP